MYEHLFWIRKIIRNWSTIIRRNSFRTVPLGIHGSSRSRSYRFEERRTVYQVPKCRAEVRVDSEARLTIGESLRVHASGSGTTARKVCSVARYLRTRSIGPVRSALRPKANRSTHEKHTTTKSERERRRKPCGRREELWYRPWKLPDLA